MTQVKSPATIGTERIGKLLKEYSIPAIIAMAASSLYNIADSIFIGHGVGSLAISGLAVTFPLMNLAAAFGSLVGVGASTLISVKLGQNDFEKANQVLGNVVVLNLIIGFLFAAICLIFLDPVLYFFGASEQTIGYARDFMRIILYGNLITHMYLGLNAILRSSGYPKKAMNATLVSVVINCMLNPLFIFGFGWGIKGSALATVISQTISLIYQVIHFMNPQGYLRFQKGIYRLRKEIVGGTFAIGMSPFLVNACACLIVILINRGLMHYGGDLSIGAYGIVNRISFLFIMIMIGLNQGMQPIVGYNYGARLYSRVLETTKLTIRWAVGIAVVGFLICQLFPGVIVRMFTTDQELIDLSIFGLRVTLIIFPIVGFQIVATNFFLSIGMARTSIFLSLTRQLIFLVPFLIILPMFFGTTGVWASMPLADAISTIVTAIVFFRQIKILRKKWEVQ
ncbi:MATE family efflux transporter [Parabacteroides sp. Marseille-P3160]|uniref:MATE family efflux transporter n=2 Tax=Parabacteroides sp. Marseille-P3160 TaxID=1917887 RepID=UPI0009B9F8F3|nr:MATE family efflux transporter [Parabacteroides sp. Marseille-P3160]